MTSSLSVDICIIGGGSGGLSVAAGAAMMGAKTALIERGKMGGDCLNYGCVPSKALIAAGATAASAREAGPFGVHVDEPRIDFQRVHDHVHGVIAAIAPHDSVERFRGLGVDVIEADGRFADRQTILAGDRTIEARRVVVATGSSPSVPPIPGIDTVPYLTNETVFDLREAPRHLVVIGGGPIGCELAQAFRRLGAEVTILEQFSVLGRDDPELAEIVKAQLRTEGVAIREGIAIGKVDTVDEGVRVTIRDGDDETAVDGSHLLVAAGRRPNLDGLNLEAAEIEFSAKGITVDHRLRTTNKKVYAIGDVAGPYQFTHMAGYQAGIVLRNALFRLPAKVNYRAVPWVTYTAPELANIGLDERAARDRHGDIRVMRFTYAENDRAQAERCTEGLVKVVTSKRGKVLGASIVGHHAGELIQSWMIPVAQGMHIKHMASAIAPYPTLGEINKRAAGSYYTEALFGERTRRIVRFLAKFG